MSALATLGGVGVSLAALGYLAATDPKRRRAFRLPGADRRHVRGAWTIALLPAAALPIVGGAGDVFVWFGATSVAGWALAATSPDRAAEGARLFRRAAGSARAWAAPLAAAAETRTLRVWAAASALRPGPRSGRIDALERRVSQLEADLAAFRRDASPARIDDGRVVVELARPAGRR